MATFHAINDTTYIIDSADVSVFPCANRGYKDETSTTAVDIYSKLNTEYNIINSSSIGEHRSYIIKKDTSSMEVIVGGYHFVINAALTDYKKLGIIVRTENVVSAINTAVLSPIVSGKQLDDKVNNVLYFYGLAFLKDGASETGYTYLLDLLADIYPIDCSKVASFVCEGTTAVKLPITSQAVDIISGEAITGTRFAKNVVIDGNELTVGDQATIGFSVDGNKVTVGQGTVTTEINSDNITTGTITAANVGITNATITNASITTATVNDLYVANTGKVADSPIITEAKASTIEGKPSVNSNPAVGTSLTYARADHSHVGLSHKINSGYKADKATEIVSGSASNDTIILGDSGVGDGSFGPANDLAPDFGASFTVPMFQVNEKGIVVNAANRNVKIPTIANGTGTQGTFLANGTEVSISNLGTSGEPTFAKATITQSLTANNITVTSDLTATNITASNRITANTFNATSDRRLKENIKDYHCEKSILDLPVKKYDFINGEKNQIGCIAQDLQEICPELVHEDENGHLSIQETKLVYLLLQEVKELKSEISSLKRGE